MLTKKVIVWLLVFIVVLMESTGYGAMSPANVLACAALVAIYLKLDQIYRELHQPDEEQGSDDYDGTI